MQSNQLYQLTCRLLVVVACLVSFSAAASAQIFPGIKCVVDGAKQCKTRHETTWQGGRIYFANDQALEKFRAAVIEPLEQNNQPNLQLILKANHQLALTGQFRQHLCPITGKEFSRDHKLQVAGLNVFFHSTQACSSLLQAKSTFERAKRIFDSGNFVQTFKPVTKLPTLIAPTEAGANQPVSLAEVADQSATTIQSKK